MLHKLENPETRIASWRNDYPDTLVIQPGQTLSLRFENEGVKFEHDRFKPAVVFHITTDESPYVQRWFVRSKKLLLQIKALGESITGIKAIVKREGAGLKTEWTITKV